MISTALLESFCSQAPTHPTICTPWTRDGYTYATNSKIIVRVPAIESVPENPQAPNAAALGFHPPYSPVPLPEIPPHTMSPCEACKGEGVTYCSCEHCEGHTCKKCNGQDTTPPIQIGKGSRRYNPSDIRLIAQLPNVQIDQTADGLNNPTAFTFDGGEGLVSHIRA
jgi:hypothetical protein